MRKHLRVSQFKTEEIYLAFRLNLQANTNASHTPKLWADKSIAVSILKQEIRNTGIAIFLNSLIDVCSVQCYLFRQHQYPAESHFSTPIYDDISLRH